MTKARIRTALVGFGYWGPNQARNIAQSGELTLAAVCDQDASRAAAIQSVYPETEFVADYDALIARKDIAAIVLATPSGLHFRQTKQAMEAGKHVLVEKPLAHTTEEAIELDRLATASKLTLMVGHTFLYNNIVHDVKRRIDRGELGDIRYVYAQRLNLGRFRRDSDVLWTLAPHDISILNYWMDTGPERVSATGHAFVHRDSGIAEVAFAQFEYPGGRMAHLHLSWLDPQKRREMVVVGSDKMLVYDDINSDAHIRIYDKSAAAEQHRPMSDFADFSTRLRAGDLVVPAAQLVEPLKVQTAHFAECIRTGRRPTSDGRNGIEVVAALTAASQSMRNGGRSTPIVCPATD